MSFGKRLKFLRRREGLPVGKIAERVGLPKELLRDMEAGRRAPTRDVIHTLAAYFDVKPTYFEPRERRSATRPEAPARRPRASASGRWRKRRSRTVRLSTEDFAYFRDDAPPAPEQSRPTNPLSPDTALSNEHKTPAPDLKSARFDAVKQTPPTPHQPHQTNDNALEFLTGADSNKPLRIPLPSSATPSPPQPPQPQPRAEAHRAKAAAAPAHANPPAATDPLAALLQATDPATLVRALLHLLVQNGQLDADLLARTVAHYASKGRR